MKISKKVLYCMFLLFPLVKPDVDATAAYFGNIISEIVDDTMVIWQFASFGISIGTFLWILYKRRQKGIRVFFILECMLSIVLIYSTKNNSSMSLYRMFRELLPGFTFILIANNNCGKNIKNLMKAFYYDLTIVMFINSLFIYFGKPWQVNSGNAVYYLYGLDNYTFMITFCAFSVGAVLNVIQYNKIKLELVILYALIDGAYFYTNASTAIVVSSICILVCLSYKSKIFEAVDWKCVIIAFGAIFLFIVGSDFAAKRFGYLFSILGKLPNFSGRSHIWMIGFSAIKSKPIWGYGIDSNTISSLMTSSGLSWEIGHLHNIILEYLVKGGIVGFAIFVFMWFWELYKTREIAYQNRNVSLLIYAFLILSFLMYMFDYRIADYTSWIYIIMLSEMGVLCEESGKELIKTKNGWIIKNGTKKYRRKIC